MQHMFLKIGDKKNSIDGESADTNGKNLLGKDGHDKWIEVLSFREKVIQPASPVLGSTQGRTIERTQLEDFEIRKYVDVATPMIHQRCAAGDHIDKVILEMYRSEAFGAAFQPVLIPMQVLSEVSQRG